MNNGHRQDVLILHHGFWNWLKTVGLCAFKPHHFIALINRAASTLASDLALARTNYSKKRLYFIGLCVSFRDQFPAWRTLSRSWSYSGKELFSPYKHNSAKGISLRAHNCSPTRSQYRPSKQFTKS
jgi:hypothetical protein